MGQRPWTSSVVPQMWNRVNRWPGHCTPTRLPERTENPALHKHEHINVPNSIIHSNKVETTHVHQLVNKLQYIPPMGWYYSTIKRKYCSSCYNMGEPWKHYAERKKPDTSDCVSAVRACEMCRRSKSVEAECEWVLAEGWVKAERLLMSVVSFRGDKCSGIR